MFKKADLEFRQESLAGYTTAPAHHIKSIAASAKRFLHRNASRTLPPAQLTDAVQRHSPAGERDAVLEVLRFELDSYLHEPLADQMKVVSGSEYHVIWCDPLRYWAVCTLLHFDRRFSPVWIGC